MASPAEMWEAMKRTIATYTGLSPAAFFTAVAVAAALYHVVSGFLAPPPPPPPRRHDSEPEGEPLPPPVQLGEVTEEELKVYDGSDPKKPLLMAIKGQIYDVTQSRMFYGPGGPYALFAGKDASRALAKMSFEPQDLTGDISGLGPFELDALQDWEYKFMSKYIKVGTVKKTVPVADADIATSSETAARDSDSLAACQTEHIKSRDVGSSSYESEPNEANEDLGTGDAAEDRPKEFSLEEHVNPKEVEPAAAVDLGSGSDVVGVKHHSTERTDAEMVLADEPSSGVAEYHVETAEKAPKDPHVEEKVDAEGSEKAYGNEAGDGTLASHADLVEKASAEKGAHAA